MFYKYCTFFLLTIYALDVNAVQKVQKFGSLKPTIINLRNGPGQEYDIVTIYKKTIIPVEVLHKISTWYMIKDVTGSTGWVSSNLINIGSKKRTILNLKKQKICRFADLNNCKSVGIIEKNAVARLKKCNQKYCRVLSIDNKVSGWVDKRYIYGITMDEII